MQLIMDKWRNTCGYISVEIVIIVAIILIGGTIGVSKYSAKGKETTNKTTNKVEQTVAFVGEVSSGSNKNDGNETNNSDNSSNVKQVFLSEVNSKHMTANNDGTYTFTLDESYENNVFTHHEIQLWKTLTYSLDESNYKCVLATSKLGITSKEYTHKLETGNYYIRIKANGTTRDSAIVYKNCYFENGKTYIFSSNILKATEKEYIVKNVSIVEKQ